MKTQQLRPKERRKIESFIKKFKSARQNKMKLVEKVFSTIKNEFQSTLRLGGGMKATDLLKKDHKKVKSLIKKLKSASSDKRALVAQIEEEIKIHSRCEEQIFYAEMKKIDSERVAEAAEEHHRVDVILAELKEMTGGEGETFDAKVTLLEENLEHHIEEEEGEMFPEAEKKLKGQLENLGSEIKYLKGELKVKGRKAA
ncbi:MAG TPA: hemerythrin domain-containing protein [Candidatus Manganitrophaceae bacterium]|nr:hemerythrin domain-containing protein [Candidatus Manganitrophaceae bacterium]